MNKRKKTMIRRLALIPLLAGLALAATACSSTGGESSSSAEGGLVIPAGIATPEELSEVLNAHTMVVRLESEPTDGDPEGLSSSLGAAVFYPNGDAEVSAGGLFSYLRVGGKTYFQGNSGGGAFTLPGPDGELQRIEPGTWYLLEGEANPFTAGIPLTLGGLLVPDPSQMMGAGLEGVPEFAYTLTETEDGYEIAMSSDDPAVPASTITLTLDDQRRLVGATQASNGSEETLIVTYPKDAPPITAPANPTVVGG